MSMIKYMLMCFQEVKESIKMYKEKGKIPYRYTEK